MIMIPGKDANVKKPTSMQQALLKANIISDDDVKKVQKEQHEKQLKKFKEKQLAIKKSTKKQHGDASSGDLVTTALILSQAATNSKHNGTRNVVHNIYDPLFLKWANNLSNLNVSIKNKDTNCCVCGSFGTMVEQFIALHGQHLTEFTNNPDNKSFSFLIDPKINKKYILELKAKTKDMGVPLGNVSIPSVTKLSTLKMCKECVMLMKVFRKDIIVNSLTFFTF